MEMPTCKTCPYFDALFGGCHRHAPRPKMLLLPDEDYDVPDTRAWWPRVEHDDFCGEHPEFSAYLAYFRPDEAISA